MIKGIKMIKPTQVSEFKDVNLDGNNYDILLHGLRVYDWECDIYDVYGQGRNANIITDIDFDLVVIFLYGNEIEITQNDAEWVLIKEQVKSHILDDEKYMIEWRDREFGI